MPWTECAAVVLDASEVGASSHASSANEATAASARPIRFVIGFFPRSVKVCLIIFSAFDYCALRGIRKSLVVAGLLLAVMELPTIEVVPPCWTGWLTVTAPTG